MKLSDAVELIVRDMCGWNDSRFADAYLCAAHASDEELKLVGLDVNQDVMRSTIASIISTEADITQSLVAARIQSEGEARQIAILNGVNLVPFIHASCSLCEQPVSNVGLAVEIMARGGEAPKFPEAVEWILTTGNDVPDELRAAMNKSIDESIAALGIWVGKDKDGNAIYDEKEIVDALGGTNVN